MCFSATASFIAGTALSVTGIATLTITKSGKDRPFAIIPLLFGIQQLTEGVIWLSFSHDLPMLRQVMTYLYSLFSHVLWPVYLPLAVGVMETVHWRRKTILVLGLSGVAVGLYLLYFILKFPVVAEITGGHIVYVSPHFYQLPVMIIYLLATCVSCLFSSHKFVKLFGVLLFLTFLAAYRIHALTLVSVWCFFAAILSLLVYLHIRFRRDG